MIQRGASIVIPNWNGRKLLGESLPAVIQAVKFDGGGHEIIVVDNGSTDQSAAFVESNFPTVKLVRLRTNKGFATASNIGVLSGQNDVVVLLNNDIAVQRNFLGSLLKHFKDDRVFAVCCRILIEGKEKLNESVTRGRFRFGRFSISWPEKEENKKGIETTSPILYACGGASAYNRKKFIELGGFDSLFRPFYGEDVDLSYRAWKRGWKVYYEPQSKVFHKYQGTIGKNYDPKYIEFIKEKNHFLFMWKNITDKWFFLQHFLFLPARLLRALFKGDFIYPRSFFGALKQLREARTRRNGERSLNVLSDRKVLELSSMEVL